MVGVRPEVMVLLREIAIGKVTKFEHAPGHSSMVSQRAALLVLLRSGDDETVREVGRQIAEFKDGPYGRISQLLGDVVRSEQMALVPFLGEALFLGGDNVEGDTLLSGFLLNRSILACDCMIDIVKAAGETPDGVRSWIQDIKKSSAGVKRDAMRKWWKNNAKYFVSKDYGALVAGVETSAP